MIIKPKIRGLICTASHPTGCMKNVYEQVNYIKRQPPLNTTAKNVLVIGSSTGLGLASRVTSAFSFGAKTIGVFLEKPPTKVRTATAGFYNSIAFHKAANKDGLIAKSINGDAFSTKTKERTIELIKKKFGQIDLVIYSLATPKRVIPNSGEVHRTTFNPFEKYTIKTINTDTNKVELLTSNTATPSEIYSTVKVMGGEDWEHWIKALMDAEVLSKGCKTVAFTYIGGKLSWPIYRHAAIGKAKEDLDRVATNISKFLQKLNGSANVAALKAMVTQASIAIPAMPLYISALYKVMKEARTHENSIEQIYRLFDTGIYSNSPVLDENRRFRVDDLELDLKTQSIVESIFSEVNDDNLYEITDYKGFKKDFFKIFGFGLNGIDYSRDVEHNLFSEYF